MYDTRVYKERRKERFKNDPEFRKREQQKYREKYWRNKNAKLQTIPATEDDAAAVGTLSLSSDTFESSSTVTIQANSSSAVSLEAPATTHILQPLKQETEEVDTSCFDPLAPLQTVSIKLPQTMAVLVVPVNLTSVSDDDSMQLQQIGKRVAIIRGPMTNVAEFQVLPSLQLDGHPKIVSVETDIRQIILNDPLDPLSPPGPTIQITPQVVENVSSEIIEEVVMESTPKDVKIASTKSKAEEAKNKTFAYVEAIRCGRCLEEYSDLVTLAEHQKRDHQMMSIKTTSTHVSSNTSGDPGPAKSAQLDPSELLSMEDKIAARLAKRRAEMHEKRMKHVRKAVSRGRAKLSNRVSLKSPTVVCSHCFMEFASDRLCQEHVAQEHSEEGERKSGTVEDHQVVNLDDFVDEFEEIDEVADADNKSTSGVRSVEHIITDAQGNQFVVHAESPEQLQELLASLGEGNVQVISGSSRESDSGRGGNLQYTVEIDSSGDTKLMPTSTRGSSRR